MFSQVKALIAEVAKAYKTDHKLGSDAEAVEQLTAKLASGKPQAHGATVRERASSTIFSYRVVEITDTHAPSRMHAHAHPHSPDRAHVHTHHRYENYNEPT